MAEIIDFDQVTRLKKKLEEVTNSLSEKETQLTEARNNLAQMRAVNEMLKLQLADLIQVIQGQTNTLKQIETNLKNLQGKLPTFDD